MNLVCVQYDIAWESPEANRARIRELLGRRGFAPGTLVLLPEMCMAGFSMNVAAVAEPPGGPTEAFLAGQARTHGVFLLGGVATQGGGERARNECVVFSPAGALVARYRKMHPFALAGEAAHYERGDGPVLFDWAGARVAPFICYDLRFPELARAVARSRPHLITYIANWPDARLHHWVRLLQARAIENQCYVAGVNRIGNDPRFQHSGRSLIVDPHGEIMADAGNAEGMIEATLDLEKLAEYRRAFPALQDMREDLMSATF